MKYSSRRASLTLKYLQILSTLLHQGDGLTNPHPFFLSVMSLVPAAGTDLAHQEISANFLCRIISAELLKPVLFYIFHATYPRKTDARAAGRGIPGGGMRGVWQECLSEDGRLRCEPCKCTSWVLKRTSVTLSGPTQRART